MQKPELGVRIEASYDKQNLSTSEDISQNSIAAGNLNVGYVTVNGVNSNDIYEETILRLQKNVEIKKLR